MKLVRKLLRLLPILYLFFVLLIFVFNDNSIIADNTLSASDQMVEVLRVLSPDSGYMDPLFDNFFISADFIPLSDWVNFYLSGNYFINYCFNILVYELFLSILFLIFDVFNFIITIASNWLRKGESLNE